MFKDWLRLNINTEDKKHLICPECDQHAVDFQYIGDPISLIGYLLIWCKNCNTGVHISRVAIPETANIISFNASDDTLFNRKIPDFRKLYPR